MDRRHHASGYPRPLIAVGFVMSVLSCGIGNAEAQVDRSSSTASAADAPRIENADITEPVSRFIIRYRDGSATRRLGLLAGEGARVGAEIGRNVHHVRELAVGADLVAIDGPPVSGDAMRAVMQAFARNADVEYIEPDATMHAFQFIPNDPSYPSQWHYQTGTGGARLPSAWSIASGSGITIAILDTGQVAHPDLDANTIAGYDFVSNATNARDGNARDANPNDEGDWVTANQCGSNPARNSSWHGTHVAGTAAAHTHNAVGVAGVAFNARIQHVRVLAACGGTTADIADAIIWASGGAVSGIPNNTTPARVINMSLGGTGSCGSTTQNAINAAVGRGSVVVVAAGNANVDVANATPANCGNVVTVASSDSAGNRSSFSNFGALIDVTAPGSSILSTLNSGATTQGSASYAYYSGTSMATPHVAGLAAIMLSVNRNLTPAAVESLLKSTARPMPGSCTGGCGAGLVDASAAVLRANIVFVDTFGQ